MQDLIKITTSTFGEDAVQTVNARDLHAFLGVKRDFNRWMKDQIRRARLVEGRDYLSYQLVGNLPQGGRPSTEYTLTVDAAKCIGMMSGTDKGFEVRDYFLECERVALSAPSIGLEIHKRIMAYHAQDKVTYAMAKLGSRSMNDRKAALKDLREEYRLLEGIAQLQLFLAGV